MKKLIAQILALAIAVPAWTTGCYKRVQIPKAELTNNAKFSSPEGKQTFVVTKNDPKGSSEFSSLRVENNRLIGNLKGVKGIDETTIPIDHVRQVERKEFSAGRTTLAVLGIGVGVVALAFTALILAIAIDCSGKNSCGPS
jgi:hypothetical protein